MPTNDLRQIGARTRVFYETHSYPGYEETETPHDLVEKSKRSVYARLLDEQLPLGVRILDAGCGTGQLPIFLSLAHRNVMGVDFSYNSLRQGVDFKKKFTLRNVNFAQMDLFRPSIREASFDYVFCNGVLHHTADPYGAFQNLCRMVKHGGYIAVGLYNFYGSLLLDFRKLLFRMTGDRFQWLDFWMRQKAVGEHRKRIWFIGNYKSPHDDKHTVREVLTWFKKNDIEYVNSIPKIRLSDRFTASDRLFEPHDPGSPVDHWLTQLGWILTEGKEHGLFITIGRKR